MVNLLQGINHLRCSKVQFLETNDVAVPYRVNFIPLGCKQSLVGEDEFKVRGGRDIVVSPQSGEILFRHLSNTHLEGLAHLHHPVGRIKTTCG